MSLSTDLRYAARRLSQAPGYSIAVVLMLALGIAISSTLFAVLNGVLGSLPFPNGDQLALVVSDSPERGVSEGGLTLAEARRLSQTDAPFTGFSYYAWGGLTVYDDIQPREFTIAIVGTGFFETLGLKPLIGRWFSQQDHVSEIGSMVISNAEWQRLFAGRADVIGETIETSDGVMRVIGVMPAEFAFPNVSVGGWRPIQNDKISGDQPFVWNARFLDAFARLDPTIGSAARGARLQSISREIAEAHPLTEPPWELGTLSMLEAQVGNLRSVLWGAFGIALLVMLIACSNVAILIDARQEARRHQQAVLQALGASRQRIYRGLLLEVGLLTLLAVVCGALLSGLCIELLRDLASDSLPRADAVQVDLGVWLFSLGLGLVVPLVVAAAGALRLRGGAMDAMRGARALVSATAQRRWLPVLGVALSTAGVVAGSALLVSLWKLELVEPGLRHQDVYALQLFRDGNESLPGFATRVLERLRGLPGVDSVALANAAPLSQIGNVSGEIKLKEREQPEPYQPLIRRVSADFQGLLRIPLLEGRQLSDSDRYGSEPVAIINRELALRLFGGESALGKSVELSLGADGREPHRIVGVSGDIRNRGLRQSPGPEILIPFAASPAPTMTFLISANKPLENYQKLLAEALRDVDPREASTRTFALSDEFDAELASARFFVRTVGAASLAALFLAAFGVYAVAALRQRQRIGELGLRLAMGAPPRALAAQSLRESVRSVAIGTLFGLLGAWAALRIIQAQLFEIEGSEPGVLLLGLSMLLLATLLAALPPALRAARVDPMVALRQDG